MCIFIAALRDLIAALTPDHVLILNEAKKNAGNDMLMHMQLVFPLTTQIQQEIIKNYGFPADREGELACKFLFIYSLIRKLLKIIILNFFYLINV